MSRRSLYDYEWADEVIRRYNRRRNREQQWDKAVADLQAAMVDTWAYRALVRTAEWLSRQRWVVWIDDHAPRWMYAGSREWWIALALICALAVLFGLIQRVTA